MRRTVSKEDYFAAAFVVLGRGGAGALKLSELCGALGVTTGSFYGHFESFDDFIQQLLSYWDDTTFVLLDMSDVSGDEIERVRLLKERASALPHDAEGAIRAWARTNQYVADAQDRVDARRSQALYDVIEPVVGPEAATKLTRTGLTLLAGLHTLHSTVTAQDFQDVFDVFEEQILTKVRSGSPS